MVRPSAVDAPPDPERALATRLEQSLDPETARLSGTALHALLQHLSRVPGEQRAAVAARALTTLLPGAPAQHEPLAAKAVSILSRPELSYLFGPNSRAEVPFLADALRKGEKVTIAGRIDRLVDTGDEILLVDFKSDANPPREPEGIPNAYLRQLALYALVASQLFPGRAVNAAILWTSLESLVKLTSAALADAAGGFTVR
jgi:ATP-dependent helicase/nuclease subunit A